jgi:hypothetical protein
MTDQDQYAGHPSGITFASVAGNLIVVAAAVSALLAPEEVSPEDRKVLRRTIERTMRPLVDELRNTPRLDDEGRQALERIVSHLSRGDHGQ